VKVVTVVMVVVVVMTMVMVVVVVAEIKSMATKIGFFGTKTTVIST
jgi:hypothetical protein